MVKSVLILAVLLSFLSLSASRPRDENDSFDEGLPIEEKDIEEKEKDESYRENKSFSDDVKDRPDGLLIAGENPSALDVIFTVNANDELRKVQGMPKLYDGDIRVDPKPPHHRSRRVVQERTKWPKSSDGYVYIPYTFGTSIRNVTNAFLQAIPDFNRLSCIRLIPRQSHHQDYIRVFSGSGCWTYLGRRGGSQDLSLQSYTGCATKGVAIHEILHVLGFYHEMARRDRDDHIIINYGNIYSRWQRQFREHVEGDGSVMGLPYDVGSIMHYGNYAAAINRFVKTITSRRNSNEILGQRNQMSAKDVLQLNRLYECDKHVTRL